MNVVKRNGTVEQVKFDKISSRISILPAAISCNFGFHMCVRFLSTSVTRTPRPLRYFRPNLVASSRPPAPPPTITISCWLLITAIPILKIDFGTKDRQTLTQQFLTGFHRFTSAPSLESRKAVLDFQPESVGAALALEANAQSGQPGRHRLAYHL